MFTLTPIGSCRITAPLRLGEATHGVRLNLSRCYGYCHSPAEAVQMARFMRGEVEISEDIWPLVSRSRQPTTLAAQTHVPSDLYVIELASAKELKIDGVSIQLNYLRSTYPDFFADPERVQVFWELASEKDRNKVAAYLEKNWSATAEQRRDSALLARITLDHVTRDSLRKDIQTLAELLPDLVFVSHVDACKPDGKTIRSRSQFITLVGEEVRRAGLDFFDPTELMVEFGQPAAIEDDSTSLAHFTPDFSAAIMREWMRRYVGPRSDALAGHGARQADMLRRQIDASCAEGQFARAAARVESGSPLHGAVRQKQTASQAAFLGAMKPRMSQSERATRFREAGELGLFEVACQLATTGRGAAKALSVYDLTEVALLAMTAGVIEVVEALLTSALERDIRAPRLLDLSKQLVLEHQRDLSGVFSPEQFAQLQQSFSSEEVRKALQHPAAPIDTLIAGSMRAEELAPLVAELASLRGLDDAARVLAHWRKQQKGERLRGADLVALMDHWTERAVEAKEPLARVQRLASLRVADPRHKAVRTALRDAKIDLVARFRTAGKAKDMSALAALSEEVTTLDMPLPEYDLWCARLLFADGKYAEAIQFGQRAAEGTPSKINVWVLLMRAGAKSDDLDVARDALEKVISLAGDSNPKLRAEAEKTRQKLMVEV